MFHSEPQSESRWDGGKASRNPQLRARITSNIWEGGLEEAGRLLDVAPIEVLIIPRANVTGCPVEGVAVDETEFGFLQIADILGGERASGMKRAPGGRIERTGNLARQDLSAANPRRVRHRDGSQQGRRVWVFRIGKELLSFRYLNNPTQVHDGDSVA